MFAHDVGHLCRGRRIRTSGHLDFGILSNLGASSNFPWVYADIASAACPSQSGHLAMTSITSAAVIWDADEPCSVKTALALESSFTKSPRSTTLPLNFCNFDSNSAFFEMTDVRQCSKVDFFCVFVLPEWPPFCCWHSPVAMFGLFRASSIPCPLLHSHLEFSSCEAQEWTCEPNCNGSSQ